MEVAELRKRLSKMRLHADKHGQGTPRGRPLSAEAAAPQTEACRAEHGADDGVRAALERTLQQLQLKDRRLIHFEAEAERIAEAKTKAPPPPSPPPPACLQPHAACRMPHAACSRLPPAAACASQGNVTAM